jgi:hypothetical protein
MGAKQLISQTFHVRCGLVLDKLPDNGCRFHLLGINARVLRSSEDFFKTGLTTTGYGSTDCDQVLNFFIDVFHK